jgi:hypothetical protein
MYSSVAVTALDEGELETLLGVSRRNNRRDDITGILLHVVEPAGRGGFVQVLEGAEAPVEACYARIEGDDLHAGLRVLSRGETPGREFESWTMRLETVSRSELAELAETRGPAGADGTAGVAGAVRDAAAMDRLVARFAAR